MGSYDEELLKAELYAKKQKQKQELYKIKHQYDNKKPLTFGKIALIFLLINCTVIEAYSMIVMFIFKDLSPLTVLISSVVGECIGLISYNIKSQKENTGPNGEGITYAMALKDENQNESTFKDTKTEEEKMDEMLDSLDDGSVG